MSRFLLKISYDGTAYHGWQVQPNGITVQQVLCEKLMELTKENIAVSGCSRTDAGVHANEFYCHFDVEHIAFEERIFASKIPRHIAPFVVVTASPVKS